MAEEAKGRWGRGAKLNSFTKSYQHYKFQFNITNMKTKQEFEYQHRLLQNFC